jgi:hypothetical protein
VHLPRTTYRTRRTRTMIRLIQTVDSNPACRGRRPTPNLSLSTRCRAGGYKLRGGRRRRIDFVTRKATGRIVRLGGGDSSERNVKQFSKNCKGSGTGVGRKARRSWQCAGGGDCAINVGSKDPTKILSVLRKFDATSYLIHVPGDL